jgi:hypothetical protein
MAKKVFFSFHYKPDNWRASQVRNIGAIEGNQPVSDNDWESITGRGEDAIKAWIDGQLSGRPCAAVLIGSGTAGRKWINHEIIKAWDTRKGVFGIYIHNLKDKDGQKASKGGNPFDKITLGGSSNRLSSVVKAYDPPYALSTDVYGYIGDNIAGWVDEAIRIRNNR